VTLPDTLSRIDDTVARFDRTLAAVRRIPRRGEEGVTVDGIEHGLSALAERLQALRDEVSGDSERAE
jgi:hypothetical protein